MKNHIHASWHIISYIGAAFAAYYAIVALRPRSDWQELLFWLLLFFATQFIPQVAIHVNYYMLNRNDTYSVNELTGEISFRCGVSSISFYPIDILKVVLYTSIPSYKGNMLMLAWDSYSHKIIYLSNGYKITITSLMVPDLYVPHSEDKTEVRLSLFRWASNPSLFSSNSNRT